MPQSLTSQHTIQTPAPSYGNVDSADFYWENVGVQMMGNELPEHTLCRLIRAHASYLSKAGVLGAQAESFMSAITKIDSLKRSKQFLMDSEDFVVSAFS